MSYFSIFDFLPAHLIPEVFVVDVGAKDEGENRYARLEGSGRAKIIGFEPQPEEFERLQKKANDAHIYYPYFLGGGGPGTFHICRYPGCSSLYRPDPGVIDLFSGMDASAEDGNFLIKKTERVETKRLDDIPDMPGCDFLSIDTQGSELDILKGAGALLENTAVVEMEVEFVPLYQNQPLFADVDQFMRGAGFILHKLIDLSGRAFRPFGAASGPATPMSQMLWADAVYVKDFAGFSELEAAFLLKMAVVLHETYASVDLVALALAAYDRKEKTNLSERYIKDAAADVRNFSIQFTNVKDWV